MRLILTALALFISFFMPVHFAFSQVTTTRPLANTNEIIVGSSTPVGTPQSGAKWYVNLSLGRATHYVAAGAWTPINASQDQEIVTGAVAPTGAAPTGAVSFYDTNLRQITHGVVAGNWVANTYPSPLVDFFRSGAGGTTLPNGTGDMTLPIRRNGFLGLNIDPIAALHVNPANGEGLRMQAAAPYLSFFDAAGTRTGFIRQTPSQLFLQSETATGGIGLNTNSLPRVFISSTGALKLNNYTTPTSFVGTPVGSLAFDATGNVITTPPAMTTNPQATTTSFGTVTLADNASTLSGMGDKVVTDATLKNTFGTSQPFHISISSPTFRAIYGETTAEVSSGIRGSKNVGVTTGGYGVYGTLENIGGEAGVAGEALAGGGGYGVLGRAGLFASSSGTGSAIYGLNGVFGTRHSVASFDLSSGNTAWGITTNGALFAAGGVTTSDERVKEDFKKINLDNAIALYEQIEFLTYDKLLDKTGIKKMQEAHNKSGQEGIKATKAQLLALEKEIDDLGGGGGGKLSKAERDLHKSAKQKQKDAVSLHFERHKEASTAVFSTDSKDLFVARQAGVIAQELQGLTKKIGDFEWLVKHSAKKEVEINGVKTRVDDEESILVVDYQSLDAILLAAQQEVGRRTAVKQATLEAKVSALETAFEKLKGGK